MLVFVSYSTVLGLIESSKLMCSYTILDANTLYCKNINFLYLCRYFIPIQTTFCCDGYRLEGKEISCGILILFLPQFYILSG